MRKSLVFAVSAVLALLAPAAAEAHHVDTNSTATCTQATVGFVGFNHWDTSEGVSIVVTIDGKQVASQKLSASDFRDLLGDGNPAILTYTKPADADAHTVVVTANWRTGRDSYTRTVSNCCPPQACCTTPGPTGPAGPAGPPGPPSEPSTNVVERTIERVVVEEPSCTSHRVFTFLVKRGHQPEGKRYRLIKVRSVRASETYTVAGKRQFKVTQRVVRVRGHRRVQVTVSPRYAAGVKAVPGQLFSTRVQVTLTNGKRYVLQRLRRLCMPADGDLNNPSALAPTTPSASTSRSSWG